MLPHERGLWVFVTGSRILVNLRMVLTFGHGVIPGFKFCTRRTPPSRNLGIEEMTARIYKKSRSKSRVSAAGSDVVCVCVP